MSLSAMQLFQYPGIEHTLALTKPPIVFSHMTGESTYRTETTAAGADSWHSVDTTEQDSAHVQTHTNKQMNSTSVI